MWDLIVSVPDHCLSFYFPFMLLSKLFALTSLCKERPLFPADFVVGLNSGSTMTHWWSTLLFFLQSLLICPNILQCQHRICRCVFAFTVLFTLLNLFLNLNL